jgi:DNA relaxase NicK
MEKTHWKVKQFEFELRTELERLAAESGLIERASEKNLRIAFDAILESYRQALASNLTAHARAMINRQFQEMRVAHEEFAAIYQAA